MLFARPKTGAHAAGSWSAAVADVPAGTSCLTKLLSVLWLSLLLGATVIG